MTARELAIKLLKETDHSGKSVAMAEGHIVQFAKDYAKALLPLYDVMQAQGNRPSEPLAADHQFEASDNYTGLCKHCGKGNLFHG